MSILAKAITQIFKKVSQSFLGDDPAISEVKNNPVSQKDTIKCKCGWKGKCSESIKKYQIVTENTVELELFCIKCRKYLGSILYKDAA